MLTASFPATVGDLCELHALRGSVQLAEVVGFDRGVAQILPYHTAAGLSPNTSVFGLSRKLKIPFGPELLGRVIDALGQPLDSLGCLRCRKRLPIFNSSPPPMARQRIRQPFVTGQRVIDGLLTCGQGQRVGLFSGSGVGKSTLLGEIAKGASSDVNVIALIGERGREVRPFLDDCLGSEGLARSVTVVSTADETPLMRVRAAQAAITIADGFRRRGANVLLLLDSMTRIAMAQREIGLLLGEPPTARGYTPSVFQLLAHLLEQLGASEHGTITGIVTVLVDGDDMDEPIADAVRSIVDGHIVLSRTLAEKGHFPAVDVSGSISRVFTDVAAPEHQRAAAKLREIFATYHEVADLIRIGAYLSGSSPQVDDAVRLLPVLTAFVRQSLRDFASFDSTLAAMKQIAAAWPY